MAPEFGFRGACYAAPCGAVRAPPAPGSGGVPGAAGVAPSTPCAGPGSASPGVGTPVQEPGLRGCHRDIPPVSGPCSGMVCNGNTLPIRSHGICQKAGDGFPVRQPRARGCHGKGHPSRNNGRNPALFSTVVQLTWPVSCSGRPGKVRGTINPNPGFVGGSGAVDGADIYFSQVVHLVWRRARWTVEENGIRRLSRITRP